MGSVVSTHWKIPFVVTMLSFFVAVATSASAECAWVLWATDGGLYAIHSAYETKVLCEKTRKDVYDYEVQPRLKELRKAGKPLITTSYHCLPDTVDPRGTRAK